MLFALSFGLLVAPVRAALPVNRPADELLSLDLSVYVAAKPVHLILVEKDFQRLRVLRHDGRLQVVAEYFAATGEHFGPKLIEGDAKTPEGIYFIIKRFTDTKVTVFGTRAFHLNYPNIFDLNEGKSGNGIYIHGTNKALRSNSTNGCITLNNVDLEGLAAFLAVGTTPVIIVSSLQKLNAGRGVYPDLTSKNFALARELLGLNSSPEGSFVSLFLLRVNGQTVVAGDYRQPASTKRQNYVAAYLDLTPENGWYALQTMPEPGALEAGGARVAALTEPAPLEGDEPPADSWRVIWKPRQEDVYLSWYRNSIKDDFDLAVKTAEPAALPLTQTDNRIIYGLFLLATCLSIGSALIFIRTQARRMKENFEFGAGVPLPPGLRADELIESLRQVESLQGDIQRAKETLQMLQEYVHEETHGMDIQDLQARIDELESELAQKRGEIEQLATEKAALKLKGMARLSGQVEELSAMRQELQLAQEQLAESRQDLGRVPLLEEMVAAQKSEIQQLFAEKASMKLQMSVSPDQQEAMAKLRQEASTLEEALAAEKERRQNLENQVEVLGEETAAELAASQLEVKELKARVATLRQAADRTELEAELLAVRDELLSMQEAFSSEQQRSAALNQRLVRVSELEELLAAQEVRLARLAEEKATLEARLETTEVEAELEAVRRELAASQEARLAEQARLVVLEEELAQQGGELEQLAAERAALSEQLAEGEWKEELREARSRLAVVQEALQAAQEKNQRLSSQADRISELEELLLARQVELTNLSTEKKALLASFEEERSARMEALEDRLDSLSQELETERAERQRAQRLAQESRAEAAGLAAEMESLQREQAIARQERQEFTAARLAEESPPVALAEEISGPVAGAAVEQQTERFERPEPIPEAPMQAASPQPAKQSATWVTGSNLLPDDILQSWIKS